MKYYSTITNVKTMRHGEVTKICFITNDPNEIGYVQANKTRDFRVKAETDPFPAVNVEKELLWLQAFAEKRGHAFTTASIEKVIFNNPATIVIWKDGTKTVVKRQKGERWDKEKGLAMAIVKKVFGNKGNYCNQFKKWIDQEK